MSDVDAPTNNTGEDGPKTIPETDMKFIMSCLQNCVGGSILVNVSAVAEECGFGNLKSVANKMSKMRKDYNIPLAPGKTTDATSTADKPTKTATPRKRAAKTDANGEPASPRKRKAPVKKTAAAAKSAAPIKEEVDAASDEMDEA